MYYFNLKFSAPYFIIGICYSSFSWFTVPENPYLASSQAFFWAPLSRNISFSYTAFRPTFSSLAAPHKQEVHLKCCKQASFYIKYEASFTVALHEGVSTQPSHNGSQYSKTSKRTINCKPLAVKQLFRLSTNLFNQRKTEPATHELWRPQVRADANRVREKRLHQPKQFTNRVSEEAGTWWVISGRHCNNDGVKWGEREKANRECYYFIIYRFS